MSMTITSNFEDLISEINDESASRGLAFERGFDPELVMLGRESADNAVLLTNVGLFSLPWPAILATIYNSNPENLTQAIVSRDGFFHLEISPAMKHVSSHSLREKAFSQLEIFDTQPWLRVTFGCIEEEKNVEILSVSNEVNIISLYRASPNAGRRFVRFVFDFLFPETQSLHFLGVKHNVSFKSKSGSLVKTNFRRGRGYPERYFYRPIALDIEITQRCTLECKECAILPDIKNAEPGLSIGTLCDALSQAEVLGMYAYSITGGEPFIRHKDMCTLISAFPRLDCFKIQTNGTFFSADKKSSELIEDLRSAGFGSNNQEVSSTLQCSVGIQNYPGGAEENNVICLAKAISPYISEDTQGDFALGLSVTAPEFQDAGELFVSWRRTLARQAGIVWGSDRAHIRVMPVNFCDHHSTEADTISLPLRQHLEEMISGWGNCFVAENTPWPRLLLRATGQVFACSCFGHVFDLGYFPENSLSELIEKANEIQNFQMIHQHGVLGLLQSIENMEDSSIGDQLIPSTMTVCQMCGIINRKRGVPDGLVSISRHTSSV